ncbi:tRNA 2-selenouridine synthase [Desulfurobacterium pacificum]|uniref:tRNA 2-selenouridine synthase n=1 Tax=Desulfurobacterium pacificum TaxID=240166 RepID=A0ABY1N7K6_9BACT|nr:tRNA 2-selenouridine(34) synthase MnmH [Desulfurobacterium pacificum]SMP02139.1 tRNA 2-selenouridine synthase [Desulfurobacterium pacificum]
MELVKEIDVKDAVEKGFTLVDVRTRREFEEFHIPGAVNVPLFDEEEREKVSKVYYEKGEKEARIFALELVSPKLSGIVRKIREIKEKKERVAVYCWRGGMRSLAVASICNLCGVYVFRLKGGYRAFRRYVLEEIERLVEDKKFIVLYGPTGVGKTRILRKLKEGGFPILDLEGLAGHRGSVFGGIGLRQPSQKMFDSLLWLELKELKNQPFVIVEGESRKIGNIHLPEPVWKKMLEGRRVLVELPLDERVRISMEDYGVGDFPISVYLDALKRIRRILGDKKYSEIKGLIESGKFEEAVRELMVNYYDKLYEKSTPPPHTTIKAETFNQAYELLKSFLTQRSGK